MKSETARIIDLAATYVQVPHVFICGFIAAVAFAVTEGDRSMPIYAWFPATGIWKSYIDVDGRIKHRVIPYKELFN
jgi:hypothetical protein|nr:MAG TPA: hypothetical protein [Caudoviricetes sp.]